MKGKELLDRTYCPPAGFDSLTAADKVIESVIDRVFARILDKIVA
jgi:hypothetical protein